MPPFRTEPWRRRLRMPLRPKEHRCTRLGRCAMARDFPVHFKLPLLTCPGYVQGFSDTPIMPASNSGSGTSFEIAHGRVFAKLCQAHMACNVRFVKQWVRDKRIAFNGHIWLPGQNARLVTSPRAPTARQRVVCNKNRFELKSFSLHQLCAARGGSGCLNSNSMALVTVVLCAALLKNLQHHHRIGRRFANNV